MNNKRNNGERTARPGNYMQDRKDEKKALNSRMNTLIDNVKSSLDGLIDFVRKQNE